MSSQTLTGKSLSVWSIRVRGTVQGVGFRPTVFRLAKELDIKGHVLNDGQGVLIEAWCDENKMNEFVDAIHNQSPKLAFIEAIETSELIDSSRIVGLAEPTNFIITLSETNPVATNIPSDAATCANAWKTPSALQSSIPLSIYQLHKLWAQAFDH